MDSIPAWIFEIIGGDTPNRTMTMFNGSFTGASVEGGAKSSNDPNSLFPRFRLDGHV